MEIDEKQTTAGGLRAQRDEGIRKRQADLELPKKLHQAQKEVELKRLGLRSVAVSDVEIESVRSKIHLQELKNQRLTEESRCVCSKNQTRMLMLIEWCRKGALLLKKREYMWSMEHAES